MKQVKKLLLVDDNPEILLLYNELFQQPKLEIFSAKNGSEALLIMQQHSFNLLITDYDMPFLNGLELITKIRNTDPEISIILSTGSGRDFSSSKNELRINYIFTKPFNNIDRLIHLVSQLCFN